MEHIRRNKWKRYDEICKSISPWPSWFYDDERACEYSAEDFVNEYGLNDEEADNLIQKLLKEHKLVETDTEGVYRAVRICDICGREFDDFDLQENHHHSYHFGWPSKFDLMDIEFDVCADCFDKLVDAILPLFPKSPLKDGDIFQEDYNKGPYITSVERHDEDPF